MINASEIEKILQEKLTPTYILVTDNSEKHQGHPEAIKHGGGHFHVEIISAQFTNKTAIERHQMIYQALHMPRKDIHALSIIAKTRKENKCEKMRSLISNIEAKS